MSTKSRFGYLSYKKMLTYINEGKLDAYDMVFGEDTHEFYVISPDLVPCSIRSRVYVFNSVKEANEQLNKQSTTYEGQIVAIKQEASITAYIVAKDTSGAFYATTLASYDGAVDYNSLGNRPIANLIGTISNPINIVDLDTGIYAIKGQYTIDSNLESTTYLSANTNLFMVTKEDSITHVKIITSNEITDYVIDESSINKTKIVTEQYLNEVLAFVGTGGTVAVVTVTTDTTTEGALKSYTIKQGTTTVGVIDIPKDMVVESGSVVVNPEGQEAGTYIKLVLANVAEPLYINVGKLVDIYTVEANATQVQLAIDASTREISATIVAGSITAAELASDAVTTVKIADSNVTKVKLSTEVQASLAKADAAVPQATYDTKIAELEQAEKVLQDTIDALEEDTHTHDNKEELDRIASGDKDKWDSAAEKAHEHENKAVLDGVTEAKVTAWDASEQNAKNHANDLNTAMDKRVATVEGLVGAGFASIVHTHKVSEITDFPSMPTKLSELNNDKNYSIVTINDDDAGNVTISINN